MILPGLIDAHNHPGQYLSKGIGDDVGILTWLYERVYPYEAQCSADDVYVGALANFVELVSNGSTCFCDPGVTTKIRWPVRPMKSASGG